MPDPEAAYTVEIVGTTGCEIRNPKGDVIAWAVDLWTAQVIARLLTEAHENGLSI